MFKAARPVAIVVETPLHAGSGSELGIVDLPIQRERHTNHPKIEASSLKGCLREAFEGHEENEACKALKKDYTTLCINPVFGPENGDEHAGALGLTDARLLLFPVKSMKGVFAWITCPAILNRLLQDLSMARTLGSAVPSPEIGDNIAALIDTIPAKSNLLLTDGKIVLEEFTFSVTANAACQSLAQWVAEHVLPQDDAFAYWRAKIAQDLVVLSDDDFCDFVSMSTEVITRTKISSETGTVQSGMLWTEEYLPADSMLYTLALASDPFDTLEEKRILKNAAEIMDFFTSGLKRAQHIFQLGGNATIGKGLVRVTMMH